MQPVSGPYRIVDSLYRILVGTYTACIGAPFGRLRPVSDPYKIVYSMLRAPVGPYTACIRSLQGRVQSESGPYGLGVGLRGEA